MRDDALRLGSGAPDIAADVWVSMDHALPSRDGVLQAAGKALNLIGALSRWPLDVSRE